MKDAPTPTSVEIARVSKYYGDDPAVRELSLEIGVGEFFSILGPSGCGKTTTLRMLAGFVSPDAGEIRIGGDDVTGMPPYKRHVNTVFQSFALFAHLDVGENVAFGLKRRKVPKPEIARRVDEMLELVRLGHRARSRPSELSGGQQQRVALARALVNMPSVLLLDEPLGALDLKLRREMQVELKTIQREVGITFVFVTHDQEEAMAMSDRIAVMDGGTLQQVGRPSEVYDRPANLFVSQFIGTSNLLSGTVRGNELAIDDGPAMALDGPVAPTGARVTASLRPEKLLLGNALDERCVRMSAEVVEVVFLGAMTHVALDVSDGRRLVALSDDRDRDLATRLRRGDRVEVGWRPHEAWLLGEDGTALASSSAAPTGSAVTA
jgi:spermidine/putrescine transport system ATP-binding protein